jgi:hypothetical protein
VGMDLHDSGVCLHGGGGLVDRHQDHVIVA